MRDDVSRLGRAVRGRVLARHGGQLSVAVAAMLVPPAAVAAFTGEGAFLLRCAVVAAVLAPLGLVLARLHAPRGVQVNEGMVLVAGVFLLAAVAMAVPMAAAGLPWVDVFFECVSGVTTTGLTTLESVEGRSPAFLFTRAWMQWVGGLGIAVFALAFVTRPGMAAKRLTRDVPEDDLEGSTRAHARRVLRLYLALTATAWLALAVASARPWQALLHTLAAVSTGGFAPHDDSLAGFGGPHLAALVLLFCVAGAVLHPLYRPGPRGRLREVLGDTQVRALLVALGVLAAALVATLHGVGGMAWRDALVEAPILALTAQTTTGFQRVAPAEVDGASQLLVIVAMFVGGGVGSTAGGVKLLRLLILIRAAQVLVLRTCLPRHAVVDPRLGGRPLGDADLREAMLVLFLFLAFLVLSWLPFLAAGHDPLASLFDVTSALGTVGLSTGVVGPELPGWLKGVICADMLLGRLEIVAWLAVLHPRTWYGRRVQS